MNRVKIGSDNGLSGATPHHYIDKVLAVEPFRINSEQTLNKLGLKCDDFHLRKCFWKCLENVAFFAQNLMCCFAAYALVSLQWRHNERDGVSNLKPHECLLSRLFGRWSKKTSKLRVTGLFVRVIHRWSVNSPHKRPVPRKMFPFNDVIMLAWDKN